MLNELGKINSLKRKLLLVPILETGGHPSGGTVSVRIKALDSIRVGKLMELLVKRLSVRFTPTRHYRNYRSVLWRPRIKSDAIL